jgi:hypothetical protein
MSLRLRPPRMDAWEPTVDPRPATISGHAAEVRKLEAKGLGLRASARELIVHNI